MSHDALNEFVYKVNTDEALRTALYEHFADLKDVPADDLIAFAGAQGYNFSVEEAEAELTDHALEGVAGGLSGTVFPKVEIDVTVAADSDAEEIRVIYAPLTQSFNFMKIHW